MLLFPVNHCDCSVCVQFSTSIDTHTHMKVIRSTITGAAMNVAINSQIEAYGHFFVCCLFHYNFLLAKNTFRINNFSYHTSLRNNFRIKVIFVLCKNVIALQTTKKCTLFICMLQNFGWLYNLKCNFSFV